MTRRGSLVYYLAAWVCGCFFMSATIWLGSLWPSTARSVSSLLLIYFLWLMYGAVPSLLVGFVLRRVAKGMHWDRVWHWLAGGAIVAPMLTALLGAIATSNELHTSGWRGWMSASISSASMFYKNSIWMPLMTAPAGAATAWVLFRIDRAFTPLSPQSE